MDLVALAIWIILAVAVVAVVMWFVGKVDTSKIPQPIMYVVYAAVAIVAIIFLVRLAGAGGIRV